MADSAQNNDVWSTISGLAGKVLDYKLATVRTTSAPSGSVRNQAANPFPGTQSAFPQNDTKATFGGMTVPAWAPMAFIIGGILLLAFALFGRK